MWSFTTLNIKKCTYINTEPTHSHLYWGLIRRLEVPAVCRTRPHVYTHEDPVRRPLCLHVMGDTSALHWHFHSLHTSQEPANRPPVPSTVHQLDGQLGNVWASWHVWRRNLSDKWLSQADCNWLVRRGGGTAKWRKRSIQPGRLCHCVLFTNQAIFLPFSHFTFFYSTSGLL